MKFDDEELLKQSIDDLEKAGVNQQVDYSKIKYFLVFYALPLFSAVVFFGVVMYGIVPEVQVMFDVVAEVDQLKVKNENLQKRLDKLAIVQSNSLVEQELINKINDLVPTAKSEVVKFRDRVVSTAVQENLDFQNATTGETIVNSSSDNVVAESDGFTLIQIPSEFDTTGEFVDLRSFLDELYNINDFFVVNEMDLGSNYSAGSDLWNGGFTLTKYQFFSEETFDFENLFTSISEFAEPDPDVLNFLEKNFGAPEE